MIFQSLFQSNWGASISYCYFLFILQGTKWNGTRAIIQKVQYLLIYTFRGDYLYLFSSKETKKEVSWIRWSVNRSVKIVLSLYFQRENVNCFTVDKTTSLSHTSQIEMQEGKSLISWQKCSNIISILPKQLYIF